MKIVEFLVKAADNSASQIRGFIHWILQILVNFLFVYSETSEGMQQSSLDFYMFDHLSCFLPLSMISQNNEE